VLFRFAVCIYSTPASESTLEYNYFTIEEYPDIQPSTLLGAFRGIQAANKSFTIDEECVLINTNAAAMV
jgi:hypothetical protein